MTRFVVNGQKINEWGKVLGPFPYSLGAVVAGAVDVGLGRRMAARG